MITIIVKTKYQTIADRDRMLAAIKTVAPFTRGEPGVLVYESGIDFQDPLVTNSLEIYADEEALIAHNRSAHFATLIGSVSDIKSEVSLRAYEGEQKPYDLGPAIASGPMHNKTGEGNFSYRLQ
jgi:quinol monooxygenase YgiN